MNICFNFMCTGITSESETWLAVFSFSANSTNLSALGHGDFVVIVVTKNLLIPSRRLWLGINSQTAGNSGEPSNILWKGWRLVSAFQLFKCQYGLPNFWYSRLSGLKRRNINPRDVPKFCYNLPFWFGFQKVRLPVKIPFGEKFKVILNWLTDISSQRK